MDFAFTADQNDLRSAARRLLGDRLPAERLHALADDPGQPYDADLWSRLVELGWVATSAAHNGGSFLDDAVLLEEAGYALAPVPLLSAVLAVPALSADDDATVPLALAWAEPTELAAFDVVAEPTTVAVDGRLSGTKVDVADLGGARRLVVVAADGRGGPPSAFVTDVAAPGGHPEGAAYELQATTDGTRRVGVVTLVQAPAARASAAACAGMRRRALAGLALESVGIAQRALDMAADHARTREQFGRPIGSYQAVAHRVADVYVVTELARSLAYRAAWYVAACEEGAAGVHAREVDVACSAAKAAAGDAAVVATEALVQVLGGIGMTWEHLAHRLYKRALANRPWGGTPAEHRAAIAAHVLDGA